MYVHIKNRISRIRVKVKLVSLSTMLLDISNTRYMFLWISSRRLALLFILLCLCGLSICWGARVGSLWGRILGNIRIKGGASRWRKRRWISPMCSTHRKRGEIDIRSWIFSNLCLRWRWTSLKISSSHRLDLNK